MKRYINQINVSITTNRFCNLHCTHCYIMPEAFKNKTKMSKDNFKIIFKIIKDLKQIDTNLEEIEWETLGGETTLMPYEFWEEMLPYALNQIKEVNETLRVPGSMNFITNLIVKDERYFELFNKVGNDENFSIYTSWEPDTERFGKNDEKLPQYYENIKKIPNVENKTLDVIFTKKIIELGPKYILDTFCPFGITDFSFKMISAFGSGKQFFIDNMVDFKSMSKYLKKFDLLSKNYGEITFTPKDEMMSSIYKNESFQCNGNFYYDLAIEPEGLVTFNASQTLEEAVLSYKKTLNVNEKNVHYKIMFENIKEAYNKLELIHEECQDCEYLTYCNAGWYHYKINKDSIKEHSDDECPGLKMYWDFNLKNSNMHFRKPKIKKQTQKNIDKMIIETDIAQDYELYFEEISKTNIKKVSIELTKNDIFGKTILERILFYDGLDIDVNISEQVFEGLSKNQKQIVVKNIINNNYKIKILPLETLKKELAKNKFFIKNLQTILHYLDSKVVLEGDSNFSGNVDFKLIEQYMFILSNMGELRDLAQSGDGRVQITKYERGYLDHVYKEYQDIGKIYSLS